MGTGQRDIALLRSLAGVPSVTLGFCDALLQGSIDDRLASTAPHLPNPFLQHINKTTIAQTHDVKFPRHELVTDRTGQAIVSKERLFATPQPVRSSSQCTFKVGHIRSRLRPRSFTFQVLWRNHPKIETPARPSFDYNLPQWRPEADSPSLSLLASLAPSLPSSEPTRSRATGPAWRPLLGTPSAPPARGRWCSATHASTSGIATSGSLWNVPVARALLPRL